MAQLGAGLKNNILRALMGIQNELTHAYYNVMMEILRHKTKN